MTALFQNVLHATLYGSIVIAAVLLLRLVLKKAPKKYICLLWVLAGLRLLCPIQIESSLSLQPDLEPIAGVQTDVPAQTVLPAETPQVDWSQYTPAVPEDAVLPADTEVDYGDAFTAEEIPAGEPTVIDYGVIAAGVWLAGAAIMVLYCLISYLHLKGRVREAVILSEGVWECGQIDTAFILGYLRPRIYLPMGISGKNRAFLLDHERAHLKRKDHWVKLVGFLALAMHWFNPLVWLAYLLLCRDIEMACDESVVKNMALEERKAYSTALISCSSPHHSIAACPVAFGEVSVKQRIVSVLNYRKKSFWFSVIAIIAVVFVAVCFLTSPAAEEQDLSFLNYKNAIPLASEQDVFFAVHYTSEGESDSIGIGMVEGQTLAEYLEEADWSEKWFTPSDLSSPGSVAINIEDDYRITIYDRHFAAVEYQDQVRYYRIGRSDYEKALELLLPADEERLDQSWREYDIPLGTATISDAPDWGITLEASSVTPSGLTLTITQSSLLPLQELYYGQDYTLERWEDGSWTALEPIIENYGFTTEAILLPQNETTRLNIDWAWLYGKLEPGIYRIGKSIANWATIQVGVDIHLEDAPEETSYVYYAAFEIQSSENAPDWGITLEASSATSSGLTLSITQSKDLSPQKLYYTNHFTLERWENGGWTPLEMRDEDDSDLAATLIPQNQTTRVDINFTHIYNQQPAGRYRLCLEITNYVPYKSGAGVDANGEQLEDQSHTYYAEFEIPGYSVAFADDTLGALLPSGSEAVTSAYLSTQEGSAHLSRSDEIADILALLQNVRYNPEPTGKTADPEDYSQNYKRILFNNPYTAPYLQFDEACETVWAFDGSEATAVYTVEDPEAVLSLFERLYESVRNGNVTVSSFATRDKPWTWAQGLTMDAVEAVHAVVQQRTRSYGKLYSITGYSGAMRVSRFEELLALLGNLSEDSFTPKELEGEYYLDEISYGYEADSVASVTIADGANGETVVLRAMDCQLELIFCGDTGGVLEEDMVDTIKPEPVQCWEVHDEALLAYMQELLYHNASFDEYLDPAE